MICTQPMEQIYLDKVKESLRMNNNFKKLRGDDFHPSFAKVERFKEDEILRKQNEGTLTEIQ